MTGESSGGIRRHVRYLAAHPPPGFQTVGVVSPSTSAGYFVGLPYFAHDDPSWKSLSPDIVHAHGLSAAVRAVRSRSHFPGHRPRVVVTIHTTRRQTLRSSLPGGSLKLVQKALWAAGALFLRRADAVIAVAAEIRQGLKVSHVIPPAMEISFPPPGARQAVRNELGVPEKAVVALAVARLHPDKALDLFVAGLRGQSAEGWIAGEGPYRPEIEKLVAGSNVRLLGYRDDICSLLAAADVFVLPSVGEAHPLAMVEAIRAGLPVVATRVGAVPQIVGDAGIVVDPGNTEEFSKALQKILNSESLRKTLADKALARSLPTPDELVAAVGAVYEEVLAG